MSSISKIKNLQTNINKIINSQDSKYGIIISINNKIIYEKYKVLH
jgi:hypothetical protein